MKTKRGLISLGIVIILIVCYSAFWMYEASYLRAKLEKNRGQVEKSDTGDFLVYDFSHVETSGFPFSIVLTMKNPKVQWKIQDQNLDIHADTQGAVESVFSPFGQLKKIAKDGKTHLRVTQNNSQPFDLFLSGKLSLQPKFNGHIWSALKNEGLEDIGLKISRAEYSWGFDGKRVGSGEIKDALFHYLKKASSQIFSFSSDFFLDLQQGYHPTFEKFQDENTKSDLQPFFDIIAKVAESEKKVRTNFSMDLSMEIPDFETLKQISIFTLLAGPIPKFSIEAKKFKVSSDEGSFEKSGYFTISEDSKKNVSLKLETKADAHYTDLYYSQLIKLIDDIGVRVVYELKPENETLQKIKTLFQDHLADVKALVPKLQDFGTFMWHVKGSFDLNRNTRDFQAALSPWDFTTNLFGILFNFNLKHAGQNTTCQANVDLIKYKTLLHDLVSYFNRVATIFNLLKKDTTQTLNMISTETEANIIQYFTSISDQPEKSSDDVKISFTYDNGNMKVGTLDFATFSAKTAQLAAEIQQEVAPQPEKKEAPPEKESK